MTPQRILIFSCASVLTLIAGVAIVELLLSEPKGATEDYVKHTSYAAPNYLKFDVERIPEVASTANVSPVLITESYLKGFRVTGFDVSEGFLKSKYFATKGSQARGQILTLPKFQPSDINEVASHEPMGLELSGSYVDDKAIAVLEKIKSLEVLYIEHCPYVTKKGLSHIKNIKRLRTLSIGANGLTDDALEEVAKVSSLKNLYAPINRFTDKGLAQLKNMHKLAFLDLSNTAVTGGRLKDNFSDNHFDAMVLSDMYLTDKDLDAISSLNIDRLSLSNNPLITDIGVRHLSSMKQLKRLDLRGCNRVSATARQILQSELPNCEMREIFDPL